MTDTDTHARFVVEVSRVGTVDHIVDLEAESPNGTPNPLGRNMPDETSRDRSSRSPASEQIDPAAQADWKGLERRTVDGDVPTRTVQIHRATCWFEQFD